MKTTAVFVLLQFILGFGLAIAGIIFFSEYDKLSLNDSILLNFIIGFLCMLAGVGLVGYFHLKTKHVVHRFGLAMTVCAAGIVAFLTLYLMIKNFLPSNFGILSLFIPLTGAVFGFNLIAIAAISDKRSS